jgi:flagellar FliL protein
MKAIILLIFGLALLGGAGYGGWMLYQKYILGEEVAEPAPPKDVPPPPTAYVRMAPIAIPSIGRDRVEQFVTVVVTVEVVADQQPRAAQNVPRLTDAFITTLYGAVDDKTVLHGALVNIPAIKEKLTEAATKVLGDGVVRDVLVQVVTQRKL